MKLRIETPDLNLGVDAGRIVAPGEAETVLTGDRVRPGDVCAHTHLYSGLAPLGMPPPEPPPTNFVQILERVWWRLDRALDAASLRAAARLYVAEALLAGTTTVIDHHESPTLIEGSLDVLADAGAGLGIRALLCFGATERNGGREEAQRGLAECRRFLAHDRPPTIAAAVALHASFTVGDDTLREAAALCAAANAVMHVHLAEDFADVTDARGRGYEGPLERLAALGALPPGSILAHGVHLNEGEIQRVNALGCWLVQNPRSNANNGVGYPSALRHADRVALGTDGFPAVMPDEAAALCAQAEAHGDDLADLDRRVEGGHALVGERFGGRFGDVQRGARADLVVERDGDIAHVVVDGQVVVRDGALVHGDLAAIRAEAADEAEGLWERMRAL